MFGQNYENGVEAFLPTVSMIEESAVRQYLQGLLILAFGWEAQLSIRRVRRLDILRSKHKLSRIGFAPPVEVQREINRVNVVVDGVDVEGPILRGDGHIKLKGVTIAAWESCGSYATH